jgi:hypothetical protein
MEIAHRVQIAICVHGPASSDHDDSPLPAPSDREACTAPCTTTPPAVDDLGSTSGKQIAGSSHDLAGFPDDR